jgi:hypothetical protein
MTTNNLKQKTEIDNLINKHFNQNQNNNINKPWENNSCLNFINDYISLYSFENFKNNNLDTLNLDTLNLDTFYLELQKLKCFSSETLGNSMLQILSKINMNDKTKYYDIIINILEDSTKYNSSFNLYDMNELNKLNYPLAKLNNLVKLKYELNYSKNPPNSTFNIEMIQKRLIDYSQGLITPEFPFNPTKFVIAGGFVVNLLIGIISDYTDIDIYIFNDFENQSMELINYFNHICTNKIHMTYNKSIINIYPVDYKINIQLIKIAGTPQKIISDFDLSYSQMMILNWDKIQMTFDAYKAMLTGLFTINRKAVIRSYRIVKAYIKGFKLDNVEYQKSLITQKQTMNEHLLLNEVKNLIKDLNNYDFKKKSDNICNDTLETLLRQYFPINSQEYKIMTKAIHIEQNMILNTTHDEFKTYLEEVSNCKYLDLEEFDLITFDNLKYYIDMESDNNTDIVSNMNSSYPKMKEIELKSIVYNPKYYLFPLQANIGNYYKFISPLSQFCIISKLKVSDLKIIKGHKHLKAVFKPDSKLKDILTKLDCKIESLYSHFIGYNNFDKNICCFQKNADMETIMVRIKYNSLPFSDTFKELNLNRLYKFKNFNLKKDDIINVKLTISDMFINKLINPNMNTFGYHIDMKINADLTTEY